MKFIDFPPQYFQNISRFFMCAGAVFFAAAMIVLFNRRRVAKYLLHLAEDKDRFLADARTGLLAMREEIREAGAFRLGWWVVLLGGIAYRWYFVLNRPMGYDETFSYMYWASRKLPHIMGEYHNVTNQILQTIAMHFSTKLFGMEMWAVRLPVFIMGSLVLLLTYGIGRILYDKWTGLLAMALAGVSGPLLIFSTNGRGYMFITVFFLLILLVGQYIIKNENRFASALFILFAVLGVYSIPSMIHMLLGTYACMWFIYFSEKTGTRAVRLGRDTVLTLVVTLVLSGVVYLPILFRCGFDKGCLSTSVIAQHGTAETMSAFLKVVFFTEPGMGWRFLNWGAPAGVILLSMVGLLAGIAFHRKAGKHVLPLFVVCVLTGMAALIANKIVTPHKAWVPPDRSWTPYAVLYCLAVAAGWRVIIAAAAKRAKWNNCDVLLFAFIAVFCGTAVIAVMRDPKTIYYDSRLVDAKKFMPLLFNNLGPDDAILFHPRSGWDPEVFNYYLNMYGLNEWATGSPVIGDAKWFWSRVEKPKDLYLVVIDDKDNCPKYYHCEGCSGLDELMEKVPREYFEDPQEIAKFEYTTVYLIKRIKL